MVSRPFYCLLAAILFYSATFYSSGTRKMLSLLIITNPSSFTFINKYISATCDLANVNYDLFCNVTIVCKNLYDNILEVFPKRLPRCIDPLVPTPPLSPVQSLKKLNYIISKMTKKVFFFYKRKE